jgi:hypothetical protein
LAVANRTAVPAVPEECSIAAKATGDVAEDALQSIQDGT